ncbi:MAG: RluA family pseudouridine synthase [Clostridia bacterium]|nr:RluA family pseudouridine synthase [Clostridia bacterium]
MKLYYQDRFLAVCRKEPGVLSEHVPDGSGMPDLLAKELGLRAEQVFPVHRLDRTTGGLMVFALDSKTAAHLSEEIREGRLVKEYLALAEGMVESGDMVDQLYFDRGRNQSFVVKKRPGAKEARLHCTALAVYDSPFPETEKVTLCRVRLETGRTHQIRVQFASRKHPLAGDRKYGAKTRTKACMLWSAHLAFRHPDGREMAFTLGAEEGMFPMLGEIGVDISAF